MRGLGPLALALLGVWVSLLFLHAALAFPTLLSQVRSEVVHVLDTASKQLLDYYVLLTH